jgi:guanosine-3',5'-bis(diphosphate) 3'-pyrophosphohydrolase
MKALMAALDLAAKAHAGQRRKGGRIPYINHPVEVARLVAEDGWPEAAVIAALLHDVVEDTDVALAQIEDSFGAEVAALVDALTDRPAWEALPRPQRKRKQAEHIASAPAAAKAIKIADQTSNVLDVGRLPKGWAPGEARAYVEETALVVAAARDAAPGLAAIYDAALKAAREHLQEAE